ncbi:MAG: (2Fe-2S)-binding protein [Dehalococcoidia bacterium]
MGKTPGTIKKTSIAVTINGESHELEVKPWQTLLDMLREVLHLTGTKEGCGDGNCGACTVILDGREVNSCLVLAPEVDGSEILTIEGLSVQGVLDPIQRAFVDHGAIQCGFCSPGLILTTRAFLAENPHPTEPEIRVAIAGNLCRCTGYDKIVRAIMSLARP